MLWEHLHLYMSTSKFYVRPYFAIINEKPKFVLDPKEVSEVLFIGVDSCVVKNCGEILR